MQSLALVIHVVLALGVIGLVLIQHGKGADAGAAFGSGASATVFGARGAASFLTRLTTVLAALFFISSLILFYLAAHRDSGGGSVTDLLPTTQQQVAPTETDVPAAVQSEASDAATETSTGAVESDMPQNNTSSGTGTDTPSQ